MDTQLFHLSSSTGVWFTVLMVLLTLSLQTDGAMRGPHHPRNSPKLKSTGHNHYVPRTGPVGEPVPVLTHDTNILHDKE